MGSHDIDADQDPQDLRHFEERLLADADAMEHMLAEGMFEEGVRRIGIEQELFLVDDHGRPVPRAMEVLEGLGGPGPVFQNELALFNVEVALPPILLEGPAFTALERDLQRHLALVRQSAQRHGVDAVAIGILPTLGWKHLGLDWMTPKPRYAQLNRVMTRLRGGRFNISIRGADTLQGTHDNVMLESFNTSFQLHLQVGPSEFPSVYNAMQLASGPVLAASGNSPLLLGHRLWEETRIALFRQSVDERAEHKVTRGAHARVFFGEDWVKESVLEIVRDDITQFRVVLPMKEGDPMPAELLARGEMPRLKAFALHNGTIYRWNRPCYGIVDGKPTLRIENRPLPAGPTVLDNVANAAYQVGLALGIAEELGDVGKRMPFDACHSNFYNAASSGLRAALQWVDGRMRPADELVLQTLPMAARGLAAAGVDDADASKYLDIIGERVASGQTGSRWMLEGYNRLSALVPQDEALQGLVRAYVKRQRTSRPVHTWKPAAPPAREQRRAAYERIGQVMRKDVQAVQDEDAVSLAEAVMRWEGVRHVLVENAAGDLVGIVSVRDLFVALKEGKTTPTVRVAEIMHPSPITVDEETPTLEAIRIMRENKCAALPVTREGRVVGLVSEADFLTVAARLLE